MDVNMDADATLRRLGDRVLNPAEKRKMLRQLPNFHSHIVHLFPGRTFNQRPDDFVTSIANLPGWGDGHAPLPSDDPVARNFLLTPYADDPTTWDTLYDRLGDVQALMNVYVPDPARVVEDTGSVTAPVLYMAETTNVAARVLMDAGRRVVIKAYPLTTVREPDFYPYDIAHEIIIGHYLIRLVTDFKHTITPHFAFTFDWMVGPSAYLRPHLVAATRQRRQPPPLSQYVVVERADVTFDRLLKDSRLTLRTFVGVLFILLYSLEAAWQTMGFRHHDAHTGNVMFRELDKESQSPYTNRTWAYTRLDAPNRPYHLTVDDHANLFPEWIDFGRSRLLVALPGETRAVPIGTTEWSHHGAIPYGSRMDRSWDVRRLGVDLFFRVDVEELMARELASIPAHELGRRAMVVAMGRDTKSLLATMADLPNLAHVLLGELDQMRAGIRGTVPAMKSVLSDVIATYEPSASGVAVSADAYDTMRHLAADRSTSQFLRDVLAGANHRRGKPLFDNFMVSARYASKLLGPTMVLDMPAFEHLQARPSKSDVLHVGRVSPCDIYMNPVDGTPVSVPESDSDEDTMVNPRAWHHWWRRFRFC